MICNFDQRIDRRHSDSLKWQKYGDSDILPLWVADTDFRSPDCIIEALKKGWNTVSLAMENHPPI